MKAFHEIVDTLSKDEDYTFPKAGLGSNAIAQIIRKHMRGKIYLSFWDNQNQLYFYFNLYAAKF